MNKVKLLKLSVEDVYTERMDSMEVHRYNPCQFKAVECDPDYRAIVRPYIRSRVVPINRYFKQDENGRSVNLVSIDMENIEDWLPMFQGEINVAAEILISEKNRLEKENDRLYSLSEEKDYVIKSNRKLIDDFLNMSIYQKLRMLMLHKLF